jgi:AcrR family transcriptional regulator
MMSTGLFVWEAQNLGKSARTRARLMDAAVQLFARDGFEAASVNEIARVADVANGTFYVHFRDKDEIAAAVAFRMAEGVVRQLDDAMVDVTDALERISLATRRFIGLAASEPDWGLALFRALWLFDELRHNVTNYLRADLQLGVRQGVITAEIDDFLIDTFAAMALNALFGQLQGVFASDAGSRVAELQLRMLGVPPDTARQVAWRDIAQPALQLVPLLRPPAG